MINCRRIAPRRPYRHEGTTTVRFYNLTSVLFFNSLYSLRQWGFCNWNLLSVKMHRTRCASLLMYCEKVGRKHFCFPFTFQGHLHLFTSMHAISAVYIITFIIYIVWAWEEISVSKGNHLYGFVRVFGLWTQQVRRYFIEAGLPQTDFF